MSSLRRMLIAKAGQKTTNEIFIDHYGNEITTSLDDDIIICVRNLIRNGSFSSGIDYFKPDTDLTWEIKNDNSVYYIRYSSPLQQYRGLKQEQIPSTIDDHQYFSIEKERIHDMGGNTTFQIRIGNNTFGVSNNKYTGTSDAFTFNSIMHTKPPKYFQQTVGTTGGTVDITDIQMFDLTQMFSDDVRPASNAEFMSIFNNNLGFFDYTDSPTPLRAYKGNLYYALAKGVRDYAENKGKLDALNEYCCNHKDEIVLFNANKTKVDELL